MKTIDIYNCTQCPHIKYYEDEETGFTFAYCKLITDRSNPHYQGLNGSDNWKNQIPTWCPL